MKKKRKTRKKIKHLNLFLPIIIISILLVIMILVLVTTMIPKMIPFDKKTYVNNIVKNVFYNQNVSLEKLEQTLKQPMINEVIFIGKDSALRYKPNERTIKKYGLQKYEEAQDNYSKKVESIAKEKIDYRKISETKNSLQYTIKPWYIYKYSYDLNILKELIMKDAGFDFTKENMFTDEYTINEYKARVVALKILNNHLNDYDNVDNELIEFKLMFNGEEARDSELLSLYYNMEGVTSKTSPNKMSEKEIQKEISKMKKYLKNDKSYNKKNPYKI